MQNYTEWANSIWQKIEKKMAAVAPRSKNKIPNSTFDGVHDDWSSEEKITMWTNGFWPGLMWLMYEGTKNPIYKEVAEIAEASLDEAFAQYENLIHDVGFMWHIASGANYRLTGDEMSKVRNLTAASILFSRFNLRGNYIRAWNGGGGVHGEGKYDSNIGWSIIDCMMNLPLLYWASKEIGDPRFTYIAEAHADTTMDTHIRPDGSVRHIVVHDEVNGGMIDELYGQGYATGSSWSRGQSWALYGFVLSYIHTGKEAYLNAAKRVAHYFISCVCDDYLPKCDFRSPKEPIIYDSTAGAIAACGLIEIAKAVPEFERSIYMDAAVNILKALEEKFCNWDEDYDSILQMGTSAYSGQNHHLNLIYGDFYFVEAILKLKGSDFLIW
ncbi:MAG: glycoside hydrolase family 88 protein [Oscillospiraceae bacterium]|nr:glycoside hydrolase family 88 protein [Oscillospiraceae bacterium]